MTIHRLRLGRSFPLVGALTLAAFAGCASSTMLQTQPPGANVSINGMVVGKTPYTMTDSKIVGTSTMLHFDYPGYAPLDVMISRNEEVDVLPLIGGFICLVPFLWVMKYQPAHFYQLQPPTQAGPAPYAPPPQPGYAPAPSSQPPAGPAGYPPPPPGYPPAAQ